MIGSLMSDLKELVKDAIEYKKDLYDNRSADRSNSISNAAFYVSLLALMATILEYSFDAWIWRKTWKSSGRG